MSESDFTKISIFYENEEKQISIPENFSKLKELFFDEFQIDKSCSYIFNYKYENENLIKIKEENEEFEKFLKVLKEEKGIKIFVSKENNEQEEEKIENNNNQNEKEPNIENKNINNSNKNNNIINNNNLDNTHNNKQLETMENNQNKEINNEINKQENNNENNNISNNEEIINNKSNEKEEIEIMKLKIKNLEEEINKEKNKNNELNLKIEENNKNYKELEQKYNDEKNKNENSKKENEKYKKEIEEQNLKFNQIQTDFDKIKKEKEEIEKKYEDMKKMEENSEIKLKESIKKEEEHKNELKLLQEKHQNEINEILSKKDKEYKQKEIELIREYNKKLIKCKKEKMEICNTTHHGIKCQRCFKEPIEGFRYKCSICNNYNLCQECEEKNAASEGGHSHNFIKIRNELKNDENENSYINEYSYKCLNSELKIHIYKGTEEAIIPIILKNDKNIKWPENTKLIFDKNVSMINCDDIELKPLNYEEQDNYEIKLKGLKELNPNEYKIFYNFNVNGKNYGEKLCLSVFVKVNISDMIEQFRNEYKILKEKYPDEIIKKILEENNYNFETSFFKLYFL